MQKPIIRLSDKSDKVTFRCAGDLKTAIAKEAIDRRCSIEELCVGILAAAMGFDVDGDTNGKSNAA